MNTKGKLVTLVPLVRGENDERGTLAYVFWTAIETAGDWERLFWDSASDIRKGDLFHWCNYLANDVNPTVMLMFVDPEGALAGLVWFNTYDDKEKTAMIHCWIEPGHRGASTREIGEMATQYAFEVLKLVRIIGISPYPIIRNWGLKCGYKETERGEFDINGMTRTVYRVERHI
jgi:RimJ/RimL family protein N-acetyltransferase